MAKKPDDTKPQKGAASENAAVDYVRTKQELDAAEAKRQADGEFNDARQPRTDASAPAKSHPKLHKNEEEGPIQDTPGEPIVEDEP
jgi:hypothetical protein